LKASKDFLLVINR